MVLPALKGINAGFLVVSAKPEGDTECDSGQRNRLDKRVHGTRKHCDCSQKCDDASCHIRPPYFMQL